MSTKIRLIVAIIAAICSTAMTLMLVVSTYKYFDSVSDLPEYVVAGHLLMEGRGSKLYDGQTVISERKMLFPTLRDRPGLSVMSPPPAFPLFLPFAFLPVDMVKLLWSPILAGAACVSIVLLRNSYNLSNRATAWLWAVTFFLAPLFEAFKLGQISTLLMMAITSSIFLFKKNRDFSAGAVLALFVLKPQELVTFMFFLIGAGRWRAISGFATALGALAIVSAIVVGLGPYADFFIFTRSLKALNNAMQPEITATVRGQLMRLNLNYDLVQAISLSLLLAAAVFSFWWGRRQKDKAGWLESGLAVTLPLGLTTAMLCHFYDLILMVPAGIALIKSSLTRVIPGFFNAIGMLMIVALMLPVAIPVHYRLVLGDALLNPYALMMIATSIGLVFFAVRSLGRRESGTATDASAQTFT